MFWTNFRLQNRWMDFFSFLNSLFLMKKTSLYWNVLIMISLCQAFVLSSQVFKGQLLFIFFVLRCLGEKCKTFFFLFLVILLFLLLFTLLIFFLRPFFILSLLSGSLGFFSKNFFFSFLSLLARWCPTHVLKRKKSKTFFILSLAEVLAYTGA